MITLENARILSTDVYILLQDAIKDQIKQLKNDVLFWQRSERYWLTQEESEQHVETAKRMVKRKQEEIEELEKVESLLNSNTKSLYVA